MAPYGLKGQDIWTAILGPAFDLHVTRKREREAMQMRLQEEAASRAGQQAQWQSQFGQTQMAEAQNYNKLAMDKLNTEQRQRGYDVSDAATSFEQEKEKMLLDHKNRMAELEADWKHKQNEKNSEFAKTKNFYVDLNRLFQNPAFKGRVMTSDATSMLMQQYMAGNTDIAGTISALEQSGQPIWLAGSAVNDQQVEQMYGQALNSGRLVRTGKTAEDKEQEARDRAVIGYGVSKGMKDLNELDKYESDFDAEALADENFQTINDYLTNSDNGAAKEIVKKGGWSRGSIPGRTIAQFPIMYPDDPLVQQAIDNYGSWENMMDLTKIADADGLHSPEDIASIYAYGVSKNGLEADPAYVNKLIRRLLKESAQGPPTATTVKAQKISDAMKKQTPFTGKM